jgi:hypothetical protein
MTEATVKKLAPAIHPQRMQLAEQVRNVWSVTVPNDTHKGDLQRPEFWAHLATMLRPRDRIEVETEDGSYVADLLVLDAGTQYAKMAILREYRLDVVEPQSQSAAPAGHKVEWSGRHTKFRVVRESDSKVIKDGFATKADAYGWLASYGKALAA